MVIKVKKCSYVSSLEVLPPTFSLAPTWSPCMLETPLLGISPLALFSSFVLVSGCCQSCQAAIGCKPATLVSQARIVGIR